VRSWVLDRALGVSGRETLPLGTGQKLTKKGGGAMADVGRPLHIRSAQPRGEKKVGGYACLYCSFA